MPQHMAINRYWWQHGKAPPTDAHHAKKHTYQESPNNSCLLINDTSSNWTFLIATGADISVLQPTYGDQQMLGQHRKPQITHINSPFLISSRQIAHLSTPRSNIYVTLGLRPLYLWLFIIGSDLRVSHTSATTIDFPADPTKRRRHL